MNNFSRRKNAEHRDNILRELVTTEREYCRDLKLLFQVSTRDSFKFKLLNYSTSVNRHLTWTALNNWNKKELTWSICLGTCRRWLKYQNSSCLPSNLMETQGCLESSRSPPASSSTPTPWNPCTITIVWTMTRQRTCWTNMKRPKILRNIYIMAWNGSEMILPASTLSLFWSNLSKGFWSILSF